MSDPGSASDGRATSFDAFDSVQRKCSINSPASAASAMLRFFGEWNCSHSRARAKSSTRSRSSATVVFASVIAFMPRILSPGRPPSQSRNPALRPTRS